MVGNDQSSLAEVGSLSGLPFFLWGIYFSEVEDDS